MAAQCIYELVIDVFGFLIHHAYLIWFRYAKQKVDLSAADELLHSIEDLSCVYGGGEGK